MKKQDKKQQNKNTGPSDQPKQKIVVVNVHQSKLVVWAAIICSLIAFLLYANTLGHDYTVDDATVISNNKITKQGVAALPEIFTTSYRAGFWDRKEGLYRPLSVAMFAVEWQLAPESPFPGHLMNVILYALTAFLLMLTLASVFREYSLLLAFTATLLFVIHPIHTEVVANIKSRDEILCFLFAVLTLFYLDKYLRSNNKIFMVVSAIAFFFAFLSKENAITLIAIIPLFVWFFSDKSLQSTIRISLLFFGVTAVYLVLRYSILGEMSGSAEMQLINNSILGTENRIDQFATAISIMGKYFYLLFIPHPLVFDYSYNQIPVTSFGAPAALLSLAICLFLAYLAFAGIKKKNPLAFGLLFFFGTISLVANVLFLIESSMAERFTYMPSLGFAIAVSVVLLKAFKLLNPFTIKNFTDLFTVKPVFTALLGIVFVLYSFKTISRNSEWKNNLTLLAKDVKTSPNSSRIRYAYGSALLIEKALKEKDPTLKNGYLDKSIAELEKGVSILPNYSEAWNHLGIAYKEKKNGPAAVASFEKARSFKVYTDADFYISSGLAYGMTQQYDLAIADFTKAISIDPTNAEAFNNKGMYFTEKGVLDSALVFLNKAIEIKPDSYEAIYNKGNTYAKAGDYSTAINLYNQAIKIKPGYMDAVLNLGNSYAALKEYQDALKYFKLVEQADPTNVKVVFNIGITYRILGDETNAAAYFAKAEKMKSGQ
ncbi:MAG: tetratricopeptide repeat protein [Bacteroidetes bacterium]|nr:tetratricopeptide repeat protein [Bacteroidota bacterium]